MKRGNGAQGRNRTTDTAIFSRMLYQLSYLGVFFLSQRPGPSQWSPYRKHKAACPAPNGRQGVDHPIEDAGPQAAGLFIGSRAMWRGLT